MQFYPTISKDSLRLMRVENGYIIIRSDPSALNEATTSKVAETAAQLGSIVVEWAGAEKAAPELKAEAADGKHLHDGAQVKRSLVSSENYNLFGGHFIVRARCGCPSCYDHFFIEAYRKTDALTLVIKGKGGDTDDSFLSEIRILLSSGAEPRGEAAILAARRVRSA